MQVADVAPVDTGETFTLEVDMVIKAAGQMPFEKLVKKNKLENKNGKIVDQIIIVQQISKEYLLVVMREWW